MFIKAFLGIVLIIFGIIYSIIERKILYLLLPGILGLIALLNSWWWYRRHKIIGDSSENH